MSDPSPFISGRPLQPDEFIGRESELNTVFNRLRNRESTAIVGEPHIGKTSFLLKLADKPTQTARLGGLHKNFTFQYLDLHPSSPKFTPIDFWHDALADLTDSPGDAETSRKCQHVKEEGCSRRSLEKLFTYLGSKRRNLVLLLDEFETLLHHPNFQSPEFFALLRSLATRTGGLSLITASRYTIAKMNDTGRKLLVMGSPFFNHMIDIRLNPLNHTELDHLKNKAGSHFSLKDWHYIQRIAGTHPFLLQAMATSFWETEGHERFEASAERFYDRINYHYDDLWSSLDDNSRTTALILSMVEFGGRALGKDYAFGEIESVERFGPELRNLERLGLASQISEGSQFDWNTFLYWRGEKWGLNGQAFSWWVRDVAISQTRKFPLYEDWLARKRYHFLLTQEMWDKLNQSIQKVPSWALSGVARLAKSVYEEFFA